MSIDWEAIEAYAEAHSTPPAELLRAARRRDARDAEQLRR